MKSEMAGKRRQDAENIHGSREQQPGRLKKSAQYDDGVGLVVPPPGGKPTERVRDCFLIVPKGFAQHWKGTMLKIPTL
jgi:hypothetical protein